MTVQFHIGTPAAPILNSYVACTERVSIIMGPLGSGKTTASCQRILRHMVEQEPNPRGVRLTRFLVVRNTYPDLLTTTVPSFKSFFFPDEDPVDPETGEPIPREQLPPPLGRWFGGAEEPPHAEFDFACEDGTRCKSIVWFISMDRPADVRRLLGLEITAIWLSEAKELEKSLIDMMDLRHGRYPSLGQGGVMPTWHGMFGDTNKPDTDHWLYKAAEEERPRGWAFFDQPGGVTQVGVEPDGRKLWAVNPKAENLLNLPGGSAYYDAGMANKGDDWIAVYLANEYGFVRAGKPVHPEFIDSIHVARDRLEPVRGEPIILGFDFGRTPACVALQWWQGMGRFVALRELTSENMSAQSFAPECRKWLDHEFGGFEFRGWGDPAGDRAGQTVDETPMMILRSYGIPCQPAPTNDPLLRRSALRGPLMRGTLDGRRGILLSPECRMLRKGLGGGWEYERVNLIGVERYKDQPSKNKFSHICEALEYALPGEGEAQAALAPADRRFGHVRAREQEYAEMD